MANTISKVFMRSRGKQINRARIDSRTHSIYEAGRRLLARRDFDQVSMAAIAKEAGCSVGAVYNRFPEKETYLYHLIADAFHAMANSTGSMLTTHAWPRPSGISLVAQVVHQTVDTMTSPKAAGVIRATIKLSATKPLTYDLFENYRAGVAKEAISLLAPYLSGTDTAARVRIAMQIVFATVTDAILRKGLGPLRAGSDRMKGALTAFMAGYLGIGSDRQQTGGDIEDRDRPIEMDLGTEEEPLPQDGSIAVFDPDLRTYRTPVESFTKPRQSSTIRKLGSAKPSESSSAISADGQPEHSQLGTIKPTGVAFNAAGREKEIIRKKRTTFI